MRPVIVWAVIVCVAVSSATAKVSCRAGWVHHDNQCYLFLGNTQRLTWAEAKQTCNGYHSDLTSIKTLSDTVWLGEELRRQNLSAEGVWTGLTHHDKRQSWADGSPFTLSVADENRILDGCGKLNSNGLTLDDCNKKLGAVCSAQAEPLASNDCAAGWEISKGRCYMFNTAKKLRLSWPDANTLCNARGAKLLVIDSQDVQNFINTKLNDLSTAECPVLWLGFNDKNSQRQFKWVDGQVVSSGFTNWNRDQPVQINGKDNYGQIFTGNPKGYWSTSINHLVPQAYVCVIPLGQPPIRPTAPPSNYECPQNTKRYGFHCYNFVREEKTWSEARYACRTDDSMSGGDLVDVRDEEEQDFLTAEIPAHSWIGLHRIIGSNRFVWLDETNDPPYTNWNPGEPNNSGGNENCGEMVKENGRWNDHQCTERRAFICKALARVKNPGPTTPPTTRPFTPRCGFGWEDDRTSDFCYMFRSEFIAWAEARQACQNFGGDLLSITSLHEQRYIAGRINQLPGVRMWMGLNDRETKFKFKWSDGSAAPYWNWGPGEPNNYGGAQDCGTLQLSDGVWDDERCDQPYGYVCKKTASNVTATTVVPPPVTPGPGNVLGCSNGYTLWRNRCYRVFKNDKSTWDMTKAQCTATGGQPVTIRDQAEQDFIYTKVKDAFSNEPNTNYGVYIGFNSMRVRNMYEWADLAPVTYTRWARSEPNNEYEKCVLMYIKNDGDWNDYWCDGRDGNHGRGFVCMAFAMETAPTPSQAPTGCPDGYSFIHENRCYAFVEEKTSWADAKGRCEAKGAVLSDINDKYEQALISSQLAVKVSDKYWIGLTNQNDPNGNYRWTTGRRVKYTNWDDQHTGNERDSCVTITSGRFPGIWSDNQCGVAMKYICERIRDGFSTTLPPTTTAPKQCPPEWQEKNGYCFKGYQQTDKSKRLTFNEARDYCQSIGANLASVHSLEENTHIGRLFSPYPDPQSWIGHHWSGGTHKWTDGTAFDYSKWANGQPKRDSPGVDDCVEYDMRYDTWSYSNCAVAKHWHCKIKKGKDLLTPSPAPTGDTSYSCGNDKDWRHFNNYCYYVSKTTDGENQKDWYAARQYCMQAGGDLVSIHSQSENTFLSTWISKTDNTKLWIGLNEIELNGYKWSDGSASDFFMWAPGEPNDHHYGQRCVNTYVSSGKWNDDNCADPAGFICKKINGTYVPKTHPPTTVVPGYCPKGWADADNKCLGVMPEIVDNFDIAVNKCRSMGSYYDIASITNLLESTVLTALMKDQQGAYLGLTKRVENRWQWIDNSPTTFTNWAPNEPNGGYNDKCVEVWKSPTGTWNDMPCDTKRAYVCQTWKDPNNIIRTTARVPPNPQCPSGYFPYSKNCYKFYATPVTWSQADSQCKADSGNLVSIHGDGENAFVALQTVDPNTPVWIGLNDKQTSGTYRWTDGWRVDYTNWAANEPTKQPGEGCVAIDTDGRWNDTLCAKTYPYHCKIIKEPKPTTPIPTAAPICENDWMPRNEFCYYVSDTQKDFANSQLDCTQRGGFLVSIHSQAENDFVHSIYVQKQGNSYPYEFYTGLMKQGLNAGFFWVDNTPVDYTNWAPGEPNDRVGNENCVEFYTRGNLQKMWNDGYCTNMKRYVCKKRSVVNTAAPPPTTVPRPFTTLPPSRMPPPVFTTSPGGGPPPSTTVAAPPPVNPTKKGGLTTGAKVGIAQSLSG